MASRLPHDSAIDLLKERFGARFKFFAGRQSAVFPTRAEELRFLSRLAAERGIELLPVGAGTAPDEPRPKAGRLRIEFELMNEVSPSEEDIVHVGPGATWLHIEDSLRNEGRSLRVYPTSAPRATVGGWLARDGLGVGSFEYGWLSENVAGVEVVLPGGRIAEVSPRDLEPGVLISGARLLVRQAARDIPFGAFFYAPHRATDVLHDIRRRGLRLWHLSFSTANMPRTIRQHHGFLVCGAYSADHGPTPEELSELLRAHGGHPMEHTEALRVWEGRFYPLVIPEQSPEPLQMLLPMEGLTEFLQAIPENIALQGTLSRTGEILILAFARRQHSPLSSLPTATARELLEKASELGGRPYPD